ncbi:uncharacterized protein HKW66_Vig0046000 [Vigna angularis]|uniref:Transposase-associated domain-containing protein n=1 Tax=Phaseolus angularis TaxID=3914 RepID=A0A8T0L5T1_PHAAN|nr:uncharacterized protein HKW66_Vig0046000 [Vigna angularis]
MDRRWMNERRMSEEYDKGVSQFLQYVEQNAKSVNGTYFCPCVRCLNQIRQDLGNVRDHLFMYGIMRTYTVWTWHGEVLEQPTTSRGTNYVEEWMSDHLEDMIRDVGEDNFGRANLYDTLINDSEQPLFPGCSNFTRLSSTLKLFSLKARNGWTDKSFTELLELLKEMLPENNTLPIRNYEAKKILCPMGLEYQKIHACPNDCVLYTKEFASLNYCPTCGLSRFKKKSDRVTGNEGNDGAPAKVMWYLPIIPRFKRMFSVKEDAKNLKWHSDERKCDNLLRHPADSPQWKKIDDKFPEFGADPRNLRLALATDGMNPYGNLSSKHSSWPVMLMIYNLSPSLCMKRKYVMLTMMISGPRQPGNDIDVYLAPLIDDLKLLWEEGIDVFDSHVQEQFRLRAMLFCTINDFPAYGNLSGYSVKGHFACPICEENTSYLQLKHGQKTVYTRHRKFLPRNHPYRRLKKAFNGSAEDEVVCRPRNGQEVYNEVKNIDIVFGKHHKSTSAKNIWKKRSIFFKLPYWCELDVRHCIDVMHVEKNVCDSVIGTLLNVKGKSKDGIKARQDLADMGIRSELHPQIIGRRTYLPPACHTLSKKEKQSFCNCLRSVKVPQGYSSNISNLVSMQDLKLVGLKSHDCHVLMQQLLPVLIRGILPPSVRGILTRLSFFFNAICKKVVDPRGLDELENEGIRLLCQLEMYFPPSFFDIMVHLIVHLVREIRICGPVFLRWMYPVERYMKILKGYVKNQYRPEASIIERYVAEEAIEFCSSYMPSCEPVGLPKSKNEGKCEGKGVRGVTIQSVSRKQIDQAHLYVLNNTVDVIPYISDHVNEVKAANPKMSEKWHLNEHVKTFLGWFKKKVYATPHVSETLLRLSRGPNTEVITYGGYYINNISFQTKVEDDKSRVQNSGVTLQAESVHFASSKDKNPITASISYFGIIQEIWEVDYVTFRVPVFKCKWVDINSGVMMDDLGFTLVDLNKMNYTDEPFIMASQARQIFYVSDPSNNKWSVVLEGRNMHGHDDDDSLDILETTSVACRPTEDLVDDVADVMQAIRSDHNEGIWEKTIN